LLKRAKYICIALMLVVVAYEVMSFAWSTISERKAERMTELLATLKPGYTTMGNAKALFQANRVSVEILRNACGTPNKGDSCDALFLRSANSPRWVVPLHIGRHDDWLDFVVMLVPLPPVKTSGFVASLYFINGTLNWMTVGYYVGTPSVNYARATGEHSSRSSTWKYADGAMVTSISVASSVPAFDVPFPRFNFSYMYTVKCADARMLWPTAPPPTIEHHSSPACR
jgi:hypothetical protein